MKNIQLKYYKMLKNNASQYFFERCTFNMFMNCTFLANECFPWLMLWIVLCRCTDIFFFIKY